MLPDETLRGTQGDLSIEGARAPTRAVHHFCTDPIIIIDRAFGCPYLFRSGHNHSGRFCHRLNVFDVAVLKGSIP
jgi:hypothetical protein